AYGVELSDANVLACVQNGVNVIQRDLEAGLAEFASDSFDYVVLSQTLQAMHHTEAILREMLRVGRAGIVTFPNFGYWKNRLQVVRGHMPVSDDIPYQWYDTPNVHLCTMHDFEALCTKLGIRICERVVMTAGKRVNFMQNLTGSLAVYRFERN
ncbi:MAG: methionine biosynthesis protein MetW, partial [Sulfuriferula sp.]